MRPVLCAITSIEGEVVGLGRSRRELMVAVGHPIAEAVRPRIVAVDAYAVCRLAPRRQLERAIVRSAVVVEDLEVADLPPDRRILESDHAPIVRVGGRAAHRLEDPVGERARAEPHEDGGVERHQIPQAVRVVAQIAHRRPPIGAHLAFERDVPRLSAR